MNLKLIKIFSRAKILTTISSQCIKKVYGVVFIGKGIYYYEKDHLKKLEKSKFKYKSMCKSKKFFKIKVEDEAFFEKLEEEINNKNMDNVEISLVDPDVHMSFTTKIHGIELNSAELSLLIPEELVFFDRRKSARVRVESPITLNFESDGKSYCFNVFEIGENGFSFLVGKSGGISFEKGTYFEELRLTGLKKSDLLTSGSIKSERKLLPGQDERYPYGGKRYSVELVDLNEEQRDILDSFVKMMNKNNDLFSILGLTTEGET